MIKEIKNNVYYIKTYSIDEDVEYMGFIESDSIESIKKYIANELSESYYFFIEDLQYHECYYEGLISELN